MPNEDDEKFMLMYDEWIDITGRGPFQDPPGWTDPGEDPGPEGGYSICRECDKEFDETVRECSECGSEDVRHRW